MANLDNTLVPCNIQEALRSPEWKSSILEEIQALEKNGTWEIANLPIGKHHVGCKWIFTIKYKEYGSINRFKTHLVVKGFTQSYGIDYEKTFDPIAKLNTIPELLSLATNLDWPLH